MAKLKVYKRNPKFIDLVELVEDISSIGLVEGLEKYYNKPYEQEAKSIVAGPCFLQFLNKLFHIQISAGDIINLESASHSKFYMLSESGTWDEIIKLQQCRDLFVINYKKKLKHYSFSDLIDISINDIIKIYSIIN